MYRIFNDYNDNAHKFEVVDIYELDQIAELWNIMFLGVCYDKFNKPFMCYQTVSLSSEFYCVKIK